MVTEAWKKGIKMSVLTKCSGLLKTELSKCLLVYEVGGPQVMTARFL